MYVYILCTCMFVCKFVYVCVHVRVYIYIYAYLSSCIHVGMLSVYMLRSRLSGRRALLLPSRVGSEVLATVTSEIQNFNFKSLLKCESRKRNTSFRVMKRKKK